MTQFGEYEQSKLYNVLLTVPMSDHKKYVTGSQTTPKLRYLKFIFLIIFAPKKKLNKL